MNKIKNALVTCGCLFALIGIITVSTPHVSYGVVAGGAAGPEKQVVVVNTAAEPVPVTGTIAGGTVQAQQNGTWTVGIDGTPTFLVGNAADAPLPTRDVDNAARQPFQRFLVDQINPGESNAGSRISFTVPEGKRLVIEYVSFIGVVPTGQKLRVKVDAHAGGIGSHHLTLTNEGTFQGGTEDVKASQLTHFYADPGTDVFIGVARNSVNGTVGINASVSGYLVDVP